MKKNNQENINIKNIENNQINVSSLTAWHALDNKKVNDILKTSKDGLTTAEANERLAKYGKNVVPKPKPKKYLHFVLIQFRDLINIILLLVCFLFIGIGIYKLIKGDSDAYVEFVEFIIVFLLLLFGIAIASIVDYKASKSLLTEQTSTTCQVYRDGNLCTINIEDIVIGDIVYLDEGCVVPADIRLISTKAFRTQESALTGETVPIEKNANLILKENELIANKNNMAFSGSLVLNGNAVGIVVEVGINTEIGKIASLVNKETKNEPTLLQRKMNNLMYKVICLSLFLTACILVALFVLYIDSVKKDTINIIIICISSFIAFIPASIQATTIFSLCLGVNEIKKKKAICKNLSLIESLGSANMICSDKTGTLTINQMKVLKICSAQDILRKASLNTDNLKSKMFERDIKEIIRFGILCNNSYVNTETGKITGDPTETALLYLAEDAGFNIRNIREKNIRVFEQPFDSDRKMMTVATANESKKSIFTITKGACDRMLSKCTSIRIGNTTRTITQQDIDAINVTVNYLSSKALRVLGIARKELKSMPKDGDDLESQLTFIGVVGMIDPPRDEAIEAIKEFKNAGIGVAMITGDHALTALAIGKKLGIADENSVAITGQDLIAMNDDELTSRSKTCRIFARVSPNDKLRIVKAFQANNNICGMTGDGVNDAPALKGAEIGIAMGITGTDVAKDSADIILMDDNFTTIGVAIKEGRRIFRNLQNVIEFVLTCTISIGLYMFIAIILINCNGGSRNIENMPLKTLQILIMNLICDVIPCLALAVNNNTRGLMDRQPNKCKTLLTKKIWFRLIFNAVLIASINITILCIGQYVYGIRNDLIITFVFLAYTTMRFIHTFIINSNEGKLWNYHVGKELLLGVIVGLAIIYFLIFVPIINKYVVSCENIFTSSSWTDDSIGNGLNKEFVIASCCLMFGTVPLSELYKAYIQPSLFK